MSAELSFNEYGLLLPGDYSLTFEELRDSVLIVGPENGAEIAWDSLWRRHLLDNGEVLIRQLWACGIDQIYLDGSFVEKKARPNDIDGYFECSYLDIATGGLQRRLNLLDPHKVWSWDPRSRRPIPGEIKKQLPMWHVYRVELYPHYAGLMSGVVDEHGNELEFPAAFRRQRSTGRQKGIVRLVRSS